MTEIINNDFNVIITDLIKDIALVFPDILEKNTNDDIVNILKYIELELITKKEYDIIRKDDIIKDNSNNKIDEMPSDILNNYNISCNNLLNYCLNIYPKYFFELIYKNDKIFDEMEYSNNYDDCSLNNEIEKEYNTFFLPDIDFKVLFNDKCISEKTRNTLWNYLQLISITIVSNIETENTFGDAAKIFESIESEKLFSDFNDIFKNITEMYPNIEETDISDNNMFSHFKNLLDASSNLNAIPDLSNIENHLNNLFSGKIGKLAAEFTEELYNEINFDELKDSNSQNIGDVYKILMKDPKKLFKIIGNMGTKIDNQIKTGELSQKEIIEEATKMVSSITNSDFSGVNNMQIFKDMMEGFAGANKNFNRSGFNNMMNKEKMKSKMRDKLNKKKNENNDNKQEIIDDEKMKKNLFDLLKDESKDLTDLNSSLSKLMNEFDKSSSTNSKIKKRTKKPKKR
jgi:hypothetical protein